MSGDADLRGARAALEDGLALNAEGRPARASARFRRALRLLGEPGTGVDDGGAAYVRARALLGLVMSDFELRADRAAAERVLDEAEAWASRAGASGVGVAIHGQRGLLHLRAGDAPGALRALDRAVARLRDAEPADACRVLLNRGTLLMDLGRLAAARRDLEECARRAAAQGARLLEFKARHNLGYVEFLAGDLPAALAAMADAGRIEHDGSPAVALMDRGQVLLEAGLVGEADTVFARAADLLRRQRLSLDLAQVELMRARCAILGGRAPDAVRWARSAQRRFAARANEPWECRAELGVLRARLAVLLDAPTLSAARLHRLATDARAVAARARALGPTGPVEVPRVATLTAAEALVAAGDVAGAAAALADAGRLTGREPLTTALQTHLVRARLAFALGRAAAGRRSVRAGQRALAEHRRRLGSVEAVTAAAVHGERLAVAELGAALDAWDPVRVLDAVERGRATFAGPARVRPPADPELAALLVDLRRAVEAARAVDVAGAAGAAQAAGLRRDVARLGARLRERRWSHGDGTAAPSAPAAREVVAGLRAMGEAAPLVVDLVVHARTVHAVVVDGRGCRLVRLGEAVEVGAVARRVRTDLARLADPAVPDVLRPAVRSSLERGLVRLDELLLAPLDATGAVHVVAPGGLVSLPWGMLPSRRGRPTSVGPRLAGGPRPCARPVGEVVALAGPGLGLAEAEVQEVVAAWPRGRALTGPRADVAAAAEALRSADVVHLAAHGHHEPDNPLFSWLRLADGPLFAHELDGATLPGSTVVLSACEVGRASVRPGGEALGMASVLLRLGADVVVAALAPVRDDLAAALMPRLHRALARGVPPADALARATSEVDEPLPFACFAATVLGPGPGPVPGAGAGDPGRERARGDDGGDGRPGERVHAVGPGHGHAVAGGGEVGAARARREHSTPVVRGDGEGA